MNSERDEAGDGPENVEELDAPDLTGEVDLDGHDEGTEEDQEEFSSFVGAPVDKGSEDQVSELDSSSIAGPSQTPQIRQPGQDGEESVSAFDDTPSLQRSQTPSLLERPRLGSPKGSLRPFDRRFQAKRTSSGGSSIFAQAHRGPGSLTPHSRTSSVSNKAIQHDREREPDTVEAPWEVVQWKKLGKLTSEVFSEAARRKFGRITCMAVTSFVALGTSRGFVLIFDSSQQMKCIIGEGTKAIESGSVTAVAISADYSTVAAGHANGCIFTWEVSRPAKPFLQILSSGPGETRVPGKDGHVAGVSVLHLGFLGVRHTALVSADDKGMAFSHLATRGMGALGRTVKTTRILGRYPDVNAVSTRPKKPSSVLAFSPLPMGTAEYSTDSVGLVAMLTPYLMVVVSTTPVAQTQHKIFRPKDIMPHSAMSGALAWYPAMNNESLNASPEDITVPKLAYCWSNVLYIQEVSAIKHDEDSREAPPDLLFVLKASWRSEEPLVALHWLSRNIIAALTISQQLIILEHPPLQPTDSCDLLKKNIYHVDLFSPHLSQMVEKLDEENANMHGVVADAFYMSFRAYKGRLFLLGFNDISVGALSNWADRLVATMKQGDYVGAIRLATSYYAGNVDVAAVGLPTATTERHTVVGDKLVELMSASLKYAFGQNPDATDQRASEAQLEELIQSCFDACEAISDTDFLFEEVYSWFSQDEDKDRQRYRGLFFDALQTRILEGKILIVPPVVLRPFVEDFAGRDMHDALEEVLCRLNPATMDLDQITKLCKGHELFDALFYVWSQGINDYTTILGELLDAIDRGRISEDSDAIGKIYTYLSYTLTGRTYPSGEPMDPVRALKAKAETYAFLCLGSRPSADGTRTKLHRLRQLLNLDTAAFMSMLNEAFEDPFLNGSEDREDEEDLDFLTDEQRFGLTLNRQYVLDILLDFVSSSDFETDAAVFLDMFVARSVAKYPNNILLKGQVLHKVLTELCQHSTEETAEDCQLSVEYLLSTYHPPDLSALIPIFHEARFFRVIKSIYRSEGQFDKLLETCVEDSENPDGIFECINDSLRVGSKLNSQQRKDFRKVLAAELGSIVQANVAKAALTLDRSDPELHQSALNSLKDDDHSQYVYLREIMEPASNGGKPRADRQDNFSAFNEAYLRLLCDFDPHHVRPYIEKLNYGDLKLESVLPALESSGMIDSAVVLMAREGQVSRGIERLVEHLHTLGSALRGLLERIDEAPDSANITETADDLVSNLDKYAHVGIWLCNRHGKVNVNGAASGKQAESKDGKPRLRNRQSVHSELTLAENLWLELIDSIVQISREVSEVLEGDESSKDSALDTQSVLTRLRSIVQSTFTALLRATTSSTPAPRFLPILRAFLGRASKSSPSLTHLREVLGAIFSAYAFEEGILGLANQLLDKDLFVGVEEVTGLRQRGWRPLGLACGGCSKKVWGPGAGREIWEQWYKKEQAEAEKREESQDQVVQTSQADSSGKGKGKQKSDKTVQQVNDDVGSPDAVVVFACRHLFHRRCLQDLLGLSKVDNVQLQKYTCPLEA